MKVSASFLGSKNIPRDLVALNLTDVDYIHVDVMDGKFVKNKTMSFKEMRNIYKFTSKRLDVHLMVNKPSKYIDDYATLNTEYLTIHMESTEDILMNLKHIKSYGIKCGLSIKPDTPLTALEPYFPYLDLVLIMSVEPGKSGQVFLESSINKINALKQYLVAQNLPVKISIDGGIHDKIRPYLNNVDIIVAGSYILRGEDFQDQIHSLR